MYPCVYSMHTTTISRILVGIPMHTTSSSTLVCIGDRTTTSTLEYAYWLLHIRGAS